MFRMRNEKGCVNIPIKVYEKMSEDGITGGGDLDVEKMMIFVSYLSLSMLTKYIKNCALSRNEPQSKSGKDKRKILLSNYNDFIRISSEHLNKIIDNGHYRKYIDILSTCVIDVFDSYSAGNYSKSYRIKPDLINLEQKNGDLACVSIQLKNKCSLNRLIKVSEFFYRKDKTRMPSNLGFLSEHTKNFKLDVELMKKENINLYEDNKAKIEKINSDRSKFSRSNSRLYTKFVNMNKIFRPYLISIAHPDEELVSIDISNAQVIFMLNIMKARNHNGVVDSKDFARFEKLVLKGELSNYLALKSGLSRSSVKIKLFDCLIFSKNTKWYLLIRSAVVKEEDNDKRKFLRTFKNEFPSIFKWIYNYKKYVDKENKLAKNLQRIEGNFMIDALAKSLKDIKPFFTIHDSLVVHSSDVDFVVSQFKILGKEILGVDDIPVTQEIFK